MEVDRPGPGEELNPGEVTVPRVAASVIVLRDSGDGPDVLLVQRNPEARFMGGAWVFPGGAVDAVDGDDDGAHKLAGIREVQEEAGLELTGPDELLLVFPTIYHLQELTMIESVDRVLETASKRRIQPVEPRVALDQGGVARVLMPGEPGYDEAAAETA